MRRRTVVLGGAAGAVLAAAGVRAQQAAPGFRIAVIIPLAGLAAMPYLAALRDQLAKHGFVEGRNLAIDVHSPFDYSFRSAHDTAREAAASRPDAIFACTTIFALAAQRATQAIPVVFAWVGDSRTRGIGAGSRQARRHGYRSNQSFPRSDAEAAGSSGLPRSALP